MPIPQISDTIHLNHPDAGDANAGNGGDGHNNGNIDYNPVAYVDPVQTVDGASTHLHNGDHVWQTADWDAGNGGPGGFTQAQNGFLAAISNSGAGGAGGDSDSNGSQGNSSGHDTAAVAAATTATQYTQLVADQHATILAGVGGNGGNGNYALGGDISSALVHTNPETTTVHNDLDHFINAFGHIDVSHLGS
ncbi:MULTISPECIES: PE-PGRS family protein [unclassified Rhizobium]|uniref:PE-PGRS family protein n=1 Tax=unclassified Rhizobium TaxID=2613769 RepID=UPI001A98B946|nr:MULTISPECIES: PE-PGRS family protein [unclassified Rhizobium]MBX5159431.1 PE-PGRS family protein [Rhizobium sp. NZLR8]MBX5162438.1 PE-PGRS family protein [Rhizobium sp. NZLR4b]MBX5170813.1 PE-PGRS family protein [Rhizobium sp. NZLR1b]MBX5181591.1 PE-PGRS family protein [Rhizobium sp. NZLR5]MBX5188495.1 PE-PGRS family protein [Rhizobium sp. NZLR3b]